jgi:hypothetical protein
MLLKNYMNKNDPPLQVGNVAHPPINDSWRIVVDENGKLFGNLSASDLKACYKKSSFFFTDGFNHHSYTSFRAQ